MPFDRQRTNAGAKERPGCLDSIEQAAGFLPDVVHPFAKVGISGSFALPFQPYVVSLGGIDKRQYQDRSRRKLECQHPSLLSSSCRYGSTIVSLQTREQSLRPTFGRRVIVHVAIDTRVKARSAATL